MLHHNLVDAAIRLGLRPYEQTDAAETFGTPQELLAATPVEAETGERMIPHRLLEITDREDGDAPQVRLIETDTLSEPFAQLKWIASNTPSTCARILVCYCVVLC
jgi:hypothetical protein